MPSLTDNYLFVFLSVLGCIYITLATAFVVHCHRKQSWLWFRRVVAAGCYIIGAIVFALTWAVYYGYVVPRLPPSLNPDLYGTLKSWEHPCSPAGFVAFCIWLGIPAGFIWLGYTIFSSTTRDPSSGEK